MPTTNNSSRDLFPGTFEMMILESLRRQPAHGYALVQHIQQRSNDILQVEEGSLYPALQRLLKREADQRRVDHFSLDQPARAHV
jgi:PadR family transcriptional regulator PadR